MFSHTEDNQVANRVFDGGIEKSPVLAVDWRRTVLDQLK